MFARLILCVLLIGTAGAASAQAQTAQPPQQAAAKPLTPEQRATIRKQNQELVSYANQIVKMIDNDQAGQVWDGMSEVGKKAATRDEFSQKLKQERGKLGNATSRRIVALYGSQSDGHKQLPAGTYRNVRYLTRFAGSTSPKIELVSFHLDSDKKWRLSGYAISEVPQKTAQETPPPRQ